MSVTVDAIAHPGLNFQFPLSSPIWHPGLMFICFFSPRPQMMDESEACSLPGGLASVKRQFEKQEFSSTCSQSGITQCHFEQRSIQVRAQSWTSPLLPSLTQTSSQKDQPQLARGDVYLREWQQPHREIAFCFFFLFFFYLFFICKFTVSACTCKTLAAFWSLWSNQWNPMGLKLMTSSLMHTPPTQTLISQMNNCKCQY